MTAFALACRGALGHTAAVLRDGRARLLLASSAAGALAYRAVPAGIALALGLRGLSLVLGALPLCMVRPLGRALGGVVYHSRIRSAVARANMRTFIQPSHGPPLERAACTQLAHGLLLALQPARRDALLLRRLSDPPELPDLLEDLRAGGVILVSAHIGPWELLPLLLPLVGHRGASIVYRPLHNRWLNAWVRRRRSRSGGTFLPDRGSAMALESALRRGELVCLLADQRPARRAEYAPFLGRDTPFDAGFARLHAATGAPVWFAVLLMSDAADWPTFALRLTRLAPRTDGAAPARAPAALGEAALALLRAYASALDTAVRSAPSQYFWWHRRWKDEQPDEYAST